MVFERRSGTALGVTAAAIALLLGGCASSAGRHEADFAALRRALPGAYASSADAGSSNPSASGAVRLAISPIIALTVGDPVFYVRETAVGNEHLVLAERIWTLALDRQGQVLQRMYLFKDPRRWAGVAEHRELLLALLPEDLTAMGGCELIWHRSITSPATFEAEPARAADACEPGTSVSGQWVERELKLEGSKLSLSERQVGGDGVLLTTGDVTEVRLQRRGTAASGSSITPAP